MWFGFFKSNQHSPQNLVTSELMNILTLFNIHYNINLIRVSQSILTEGWCILNIAGAIR